MASAAFSQEAESIKIKNRAEFYEVLRELDAQHKQQDGKLNNPELSMSFLTTSENLLQWATNQGLEKEQNIAHKYIISYYVNKVNEAEIISRSKYLINQESYKQDSNIVHVTKALLDAYDRTGQYEEMLRWYPFFYEMNANHGNMYHRQPFDLHSDIGMILL